MCYKGNRLMCNECRYCPKFYYENGKKKYKPCKMIDHNKIRFLASVFNGYALEREDICRYYEPAEWGVSGKKEWVGIEEYIKYMDEEYYVTPKFLKEEGKSKIKDIITIPLVVGTQQDRWGDYVYYVSLYDWFTGEAIKGDVIKYKKKFKVIRSKTGKASKRELVAVDGREVV